MRSMSYTATVVLRCSAMSLLGTCAAVPATRVFRDPVYGYSVSLPAGWKPYPRTASPGEPPNRLTLITPGKGILIVSVKRLPQPVTRHSEFEGIGQTHVNRVLDAYLKALNVTSLGDQKDDKSDATSMRFWQGTSGLRASSPAMVLSLHAIPYGSAFMVNIVYVGSGNSKEEIRAVDALMSSLSFPKR